MSTLPPDALQLARAGTFSTTYFRLRSPNRRWKRDTSLAGGEILAEKAEPSNQG